MSYDSDKYGGRAAYFKSSDMEGKICIFASGKLVSVGARSEKRAYDELECFKQLLVERGFIEPVAAKGKTQNIVVIADFQQMIDFERLVECYGLIYEPEQFPGAILRMTDPFEATILFFVSGKVNIVGLKSSRQIEQVIEKVSSLVDRSRF